MTEINVVAQGGFRAAYEALVPDFERASGHTVVAAWGGATGDAPNSIPSRLARGEAIDVVIVAATGLDALIRDGRILADSRVEVARSYVGVAVRAGAPRPDISTAAAVQRALIEAKSIAFSNGASGTYLVGLFDRMGIGDAMRAKRVDTLPGSSGAVVARGDAELAFQQVAELLPVPGIDFIGRLPDELQEVILYAAGIPAAARNLEAARALIAYLTAFTAATAYARWGMEGA